MTGRFNEVVAYIVAHLLCGVHIDGVIGLLDPVWLGGMMDRTQR